MSFETHFPGLRDPLYNAAQDYGRCRCGSVARVASGLCVSCLLRNGLEIAEEPPVEDFDALLASVNVPDRDWQLGNYRVLEEIGRGGMGVIYRARHSPSQRIVALKRILNYHSDSRETLIRFQREAQAAASLDHPNILPIFDVGATEDGLPFFSMKFASGGSLVHSRNGFRESPRRAVQLVAKVSRAVDYAHVQGILHRDLKPGNILLDARGEPMVSDFGLAKWLDTSNELTQTLTVFGTPGYIAPEQVENSLAELTPATDVYSLGAILFELLSGRPPFLGEHALAVIRQAADTEAPKLRAIIPRASRDLETICARCLERDPQIRYQSAGALAEELECWLKGRPIKSRPVSPPARLYRWGRRNPLLAASAAICLVFAAGIGIRQIQNWKLESQLQQNELARNSIAVLPFLNLDNGTEQSDWTTTVTAALQFELSRLGNARVVSAAPSNDAKTAARDFRTRAVLTGTGRKTANGTRISIRFLDSDGALLFGRTVDLGAADVSTLSRQLAPLLYSVLTADDWSKLITAARDPALENQQARELIAAGRELRFRYTTLDYDRAINCFEKAIQLEPRSALAHAYLAMSAAARVQLVSDFRFLERAESEAREALRLAPELAEAHRALAGVLYQKERLQQSLEEQMRALEAGGPEEHVLGLTAMTLSALGQPDRALQWYNLTRRYASHPGNWDSFIGDCWSELADDPKAELAYRRACDLQPELPHGWVGLARLRLLRGETDAARRLCRERQEQYGESLYWVEMTAMIEFVGRNYSGAEKLYDKLTRIDRDGGATFYGDISAQSALGYLRLKRGDAKGGKRLLREALAKESAALNRAPNSAEILYRVAAIESSLGELESALADLQAAGDAGWIDYRSLAVDPRFDAIANDIRFQTLLGGLELKVEELRKTATRNVPPQK